MKKTLLLISVFAMSTFSMAQKLKVQDTDMPISKNAKKKGMYVSTTLTKSGDIRTFISYDLKGGKLGMDVITVDDDGKLLESASEVAGPSTAEKYDVEIPSPGTIENPAKGIDVVRLVSSLGVAGKFKIEEGYFKPKYATSTEYGPYLTTYTSVFRGFKFVDTESTKSDMKLNVYAAHTKQGDNLEQDYTILEGLIPNTVGYFDKKSTIAFMGRDARIPDKDAVNGANVVMSGQFNGQTGEFINIKETVLEYNQTMVTNGYDSKWNRAVLVAALNAPTSSAQLNKWQAKGKQYMTYLTMDTEGNVLDNVTFESGSIRGNFAIFGADDTNFVLGNINAGHSGYYRFDVGTATHFQIITIKGGKVTNKQMISMEDMAGMLSTPGGKKGKVKYKDIQFANFMKASNGNVLAFTLTPKEAFIYEIDMSGNLQRVYSMPRFEGTFHSVQALDCGDNLYVLYRTQNGDIAQGISKSVSRGAGYMKNVTFSRVDELQTFGRVHKINLADKTISAPVDFLPDVILGGDPMYKGSSGELILPVRDAKRNYRMVSIK